MIVTTGEFEKWLRTVCFQKPTPEAYDLAKAAWKQANRKLMFDLWDALPGHEATGDTAGSLRAMLMLSEVGDEIKARVNAEISPPRDHG